jgi:NCS1 family nucleobase:cation symporter-1
VIHRLQAVLTVVLFVTFVVFAVKVLGGQNFVTPVVMSGADLAGAFVLEITIAFSLAVSWATYAADFSRYLPAASSRTAVFGATFAGLGLGYLFVQAIGIASGDVLSEQTAEGMQAVMGGGLLGEVALLVIAVASIGSGVMNDYSGSLALQTVGVRVRRPVSAVIVTVLAFALILWLHEGDRATRFQDVLLLVSYWIPAFVAVVVIDWLIRARGRSTLNPADEITGGRDSAAALITFALAYAAAIPFMNTSLIEGPIAKAWHGADTAYFVNLVVAAALYGGYRLLTGRRASPTR